MNQFDSPWTAELENELRKLWPLQGWSATKIANHFGSDFTRNSVIGKVHRLKLAPKARPKPAAPVEHPWKRRREMQKPESEVMHHTDAPVERCDEPALGNQELPVRAGVTFENIDRHSCRYIVGEIFGWDTPYCGKEKEIGSYCLEHHLLCHQPAPPRRGTVLPFWKAA